MRDVIYSYETMPRTFVGRMFSGIAFGSLFILLSLFTGCSGEEKTVCCEKMQVVASFPNEYQLPETQPLQVNLAGVVDVFNVDSLLICKTDKEEYFWKVFNLNTLQPEGQLLREGHGRDEFAWLPSDEAGLCTDSALYCDFLDNNTWYRCNLTQSLQTGKPVWENTLSVGTNEMIYRFRNVKDDSFLKTVIKIDEKGTKLVRSIYRNGEETPIDHVGNLNTATVKEDVNIIASAAASNREKGIVAEAMIRLNQINLYSLNSDWSLTLSLSDELPDMASVESLPRALQKQVFVNIFGRDEYFIAIYSGNKRGVLFTDDAEPSTLMVFKWDGTPLSKIQVPYSVTNVFVYKGDLYLFSAAGDTEALYKYPNVKLE
jgi:hypothetical protein